MLRTPGAAWGWQECSVLCVNRVSASGAHCLVILKLYQHGAAKLETDGFALVARQCSTRIQHVEKGAASVWFGYGGWHSIFGFDIKWYIISGTTLVSFGLAFL